MLVQSIDTALAALYKTAHHKLYMSHVEGEKLAAAVARNLLVDSCYRGLAEATQGLNVPKIFHELGYIALKEAKFRVPFPFVPPQQQVEGADRAPSAAKPKPKAAPSQLTMSAFLANK